MTGLILLTAFCGLLAVAAAAAAGYSFGVGERKQRRLDEALSREFPPSDDETTEQRAQRLLHHVLPVFRNRDQATDAFFLVYPTANDRNRLLSVAAALYMLREKDEARRERQRKAFGDVATRLR